jgi:hypothetical protein
MITPQPPADTAMAKRPIAVWALLVLLVLRLALDARALISVHALIAPGPTASNSYNLYLAAASLALFRFGAVSLALVLLWRRHQAGLVIAAMLFLAELYGGVLGDLTGAVVQSAFGPPESDGDAYARALGRYSMLLAPLALIAWCSLTSSCRRYFRHAL